jgi:hypothetical protein
VQEGEAIGIFAGFERGFMYQTANGVMGHEAARELLFH